MHTQTDDISEFSHSTGDQQPQYQPATATAQPNAALTVDDVDAIARDLDDLPRVEKFDVKAQLDRLGPTLAGMKLKGYDLAAIRGRLLARGVDASISSISRAINGGGTTKPKSKKPKVAK